MKNSDQPAFPTLLYNEVNGQPNGHRQGLTKREHFAAMAMNIAVQHWYNHPIPELCERSISIADEMLRQLDSDADFAASLKA